MAAKQNPREAFIREFKKREKELAEVAKEEVGSGFLSDEEIIEMLDLDADVKKQFRSRVSRVRYGIDKNKNLYIAFNFTIKDGEHKGITVSRFIGLGGKNKEERAKGFKALCATLQRLDFDTTKWKQSEVANRAVDAADDLNKRNPRQGALIALSTWGDDNDRLNVDIVGLFDDNEPAGKSTSSSDAGDQYEDTDSSSTPGDVTYAEMGAEADTAEEESHATLEAKADEHGFDFTDAEKFPTWEALGQAIDEAEAAAGGEESEESDEPDIDYESYVDYECVFDAGEEQLDVSVTAYDSDSELFTLEDGNGETYEAGFDSLDFGEGFGVPVE